jgi:hypothetical protein
MNLSKPNNKNSDAISNQKMLSEDKFIEKILINLSD